MRRIAAVVILLSLLYFLVGFLLVYIELFDKNDYLTIASVVGGIASVFGLFSFTRPSLSNDDLQELEVESLRSITKTSEQLKELEKRRTETKEEINSLAASKKEMEFLVKKASLSLFLNDQCNRYEHTILTFVDENLELKLAIEKFSDAKEKLSALNEEIASNPNASLLSEVIEASKHKKSSLDEAIDELPPILKALVLFLRKLSRAYIDALQTMVGR